MPVNFDSLVSIVRCPVCHSAVEARPDVRCGNEGCSNRGGFPRSRGQPVLIDFEQSIFTPELYSAGEGAVLPRDVRPTAAGRFLRTLTYGSDAIAAEISKRYAERLLATNKTPRLLVVGGGTIGEGMHRIYATEAITVVGVDAYASPNTVLVCDAHALPFKDEVFDGVIIQAVLEHVLDPAQVVAEIHRVLRPGGLVFADTPFMQQVHEGAYDFTRFTKSGHRWLFRGFDEIESGIIGGPGVALLWSISYFVRALGAGPKLTAMVTALFFWVRALERFMDFSRSADGAAATYFVGVKSSHALAANEMPALYNLTERAAVD